MVPGQQSRRRGGRAERDLSEGVEGTYCRQGNTKGRGQQHSWARQGASAKRMEKGPPHGEALEKGLKDHLQGASPPLGTFPEAGRWSLGRTTGTDAQTEHKDMQGRMDSTERPGERGGPAFPLSSLATWRDPKGTGREG